MYLSDLEKLLLDFPNNSWNWWCISKNEAISYDFFRKYENRFDWDLDGLALNPNIKLEYIEESFGWGLNKPYPNFVIKFCRERNRQLITDQVNSNQINRETTQNNNFFQVINNTYNGWSMYELCSNPNITIDFIKKYPNINWNWYKLSSNSGITFSDILKTPDLPWKHGSFSSNSNLTWEIVLNNPEYFWYPDYICYNCKITETFIEELEKFFKTKTNSKYNYIYFSKLSFNKTLSINIIKKYIEREWFWFGISSNSGISFNDIINNPELPWYFNGLSSNPNIKFSFVLENLDKNWNWYSLSRNSAITWKNIQENINLPWCWRAIGFNENLTYDIVKQLLISNMASNNVSGIEKLIEYYGISYNDYGYKRDKEYKKVCFKNIEKELIEKTWHPNRIFEWCLDIDEMNEHK